jgi:unsaturated chondroitin disaccharide hydrolase
MDRRDFFALDKKLQKVAVRSRNKLPYSTDDKGEHTERQRYWWTNGFWGGLNCLMYEATKNDEYKATVDSAELLLDKAFEDFDELHHDVGFMWHLTSTASFRLYGGKLSRSRALIASSILASRFNTNGKYIRAWNGVVRGDDSKGLTIIDSMLNLPLLYWASRETGDDRFSNIAIAHADMTIRDHVTSDGRVNHVVVHDTLTGEKIDSRAGQGMAKDSAWSRGQSWALYGFTLSYIHTQKDRYLQTAVKVADRFIEQVEKTDWVPVVDFSQPKEEKRYDTSAGVVACCGLIELAKILKGEKGDKYLVSAINMLKALVKDYCDFSESTDGVLLGSTESYASPFSRNLVYGDFYFVEAILKLKGSNFLIW